MSTANLEKKQKQFTVFWRGAALAFFVLSSCFILLRPDTHFLVLPVDFNSAQWKSNESVRPNMLRDLLKHHSVMGYSMKKLVETLGEPDGEPRRYENDEKKYDSTVFYRLEKGDLISSGKYIDLIGFGLKNDKVVGVVEDQVEKYW